MSTETPKTRRKRSTKGRLTPELADELIGHLAKGMPKSTAAALCGVSRQLLNYWLQQGTEALEKDPLSKDRYALFNLRVEQACAQFQQSLLEKLDRAITDRKVDHKPIKFLLSTRWPKEFSHQVMSPASKQDEDGPETVTPEEAVLSVAAKIAEYIKANPLDDQPAPASAPEVASGE